MTLYDEVGVRPDASAEEVREAYHALARLLHPDQHGDAKLRALAEAQMRRINQVFEVLGDARKRAAYDRSLRRGTGAGAALARSVRDDPAWVESEAGGPPGWKWEAGSSGAQGAEPGAGTSPAHLLWRLAGVWRGGIAGTAAGAAAGVTAVLFLGILLQPPAKYYRPSESTAEPFRSASPKKGHEPSSEPVRGEARELRRRVRELELELENARAGTIPLNGVALPSTAGDIRTDGWGEAPTGGGAVVPTREPAHAVSSLEGGDHSEPANGSPGAGPARSRARGLAGAWVWVRTAASREAVDSYPPEFIEVIIRETGGNAAGRYRGRYRVADRAISPEVQFEFECRAERCIWQGNGGARGELELRLKRESELEIHWVTTEIGTAPALGSGSANLVRREDRR